MLMFVISNVVGSTIQITTLPLPVLSTLQAVRSICYTQAENVLTSDSLVWSSIPYVLL